MATPCSSGGEASSTAVKGAGLVGRRAVYFVVALLAAIFVASCGLHPRTEGRGTRSPDRGDGGSGLAAGEGTFLGLQATLGADGLPWLLHHKDRRLWAIHCNDEVCSAATVNELPTLCDASSAVRLARSPDGLPVVGFHCGATDSIRLIVCDSPRCASPHVQESATPDDVQLIALPAGGEKALTYYRPEGHARGGALVLLDLSSRFSEPPPRHVLRENLAGPPISIAVQGERAWVLSKDGATGRTSLREWDGTRLAESWDLGTFTRNEVLFANGALESQRIPVLVVSEYIAASFRTRQRLVYCPEPHCIELLAINNPGPALVALPGSTGPLVATRSHEGQLSLIHCFDAHCSASEETMLGSRRPHAIFINDNHRPTIISGELEIGVYSVLVCGSPECSGGSLALIDTTEWATQSTRVVGRSIENQLSPWWK